MRITTKDLAQSFSQPPLVKVYSDVLAIDRHNGFQTGDRVQGESRAFSSRWISSCHSKGLCTSNSYTRDALYTFAHGEVARRLCVRSNRYILSGCGPNRAPLILNWIVGAGVLTMAYRPSTEDRIIADGSDNKLLGNGTSVGPVVDWKERPSVSVKSLVMVWNLQFARQLDVRRHCTGTFAGERQDMPAYMLLSLWIVGSL